MKLCLNAIVKNEGEKIERMLKSVAPFITSWIIVDTGSTDDTKDRIHRFFKDAGIPGDIFDAPFENFSQARNAALDIARAMSPIFGQPDYFLLCDADMELVVKDPAGFLEDRNGTTYEMYQHAGAVQYTNARLLNALGDWHYKGVTHEFLDAPNTGRIGADMAYFVDHADGANRPDKFKRDIRLLKQGLKDEPNNERYMFYLACSYRDAGKFAEAAKWFERRIRAGGWDEEVWQAKVNRAHALAGLGDYDGFVAGLFDAYSFRPTRAEPMYDLAKYYREKPNMQPAALACIEAVRHLPKPDDILFVNDYVYSVGRLEEIGICSGYVPGKVEQGRRVTDELGTMRTPYWSAVNCARANTYHYLRPLGESCPSFKFAVMSPPTDIGEWVTLNPSVCQHKGSILTTIRCVNYTIDNDGRYIIKGTDGTANAENPIDTRNFIVDLGPDPLTCSVRHVRECYRDGKMPVVWPLVTGFEDMRLIPRGEELWCSATVRQLAADGQCEQVLTRLDTAVGEAYRHKDMKRMLREPRVTEKNWSPILWRNADMFMDRPGHVINSDGHDVIKHEPPLAVDNLSGSSQVIPFDDGWLAITHTAHPLPNEPYKRYYHHRFIEYTADFAVRRVSLPFCFHDRVIEFCAGMCWSLDNKELVISYGFQDKEARIATVNADEVRRMLDGGRTYA